MGEFAKSRSQLGGSWAPLFFPIFLKESATQAQTAVKLPKPKLTPTK